MAAYHNTASSRSHSLTPPIIWASVGCLALIVASALALAPLPTAALALALILAIIIAIINPVLGVFLLVLSVPIQEVVTLPGDVTFTQTAVMAALGGWGLHLLAHPERRIVTGRIFWLWLAFLCALLLSASVTPYSQTEALKEVMRWTVAFITWFIAVNTITRRQDAIALLICLLLAPTVGAIIGLMQFWTGTGPPSFQIGAGFVRAYSTIGTPNAFAGYLNMTWPLAFALAVGMTWAAVRRPTTDDRPPTTDHRREPAFKRSEGTTNDRPPTTDSRSITDNRQRTTDNGQQTHAQLPLIRSPAHPLISDRWLLLVGVWAITGILCAALVVTFSRGGWVGAALGCVGMALASGRHMKWVALIGGVALALAFAAGSAGLLPNAISERLTSVTRSVAFFDPATVEVTPENFAVVERTAQIWSGWRMFVTHPVSGVGPGNYTLAYQDVAVAPWYSSRGHAHNYYIHIAGEAGMIGLLTYLLLIAGVMYQAIIALRRATTPFWRSVVVGCCGIIVAVVGHSVFEQLHALNMGVHLAAVWALVVYMSSSQQ
jgi:hypothetical protein